MYHPIMFAHIGTTVGNIYSNLKTSIFGVENKKSTPKNSRIETSKDSLQDFSDPSKLLTANTDLELMVSKKPVPEKILNDIKTLTQVNGYGTQKTDPLIDDLFKEIKQILRNKEDSNLVKNQIKELSLKIAENSIQEVFQKITEIDNNSSINELKDKFTNYLQDYCHSCFLFINEIQKIVLNEALNNPEILQADFLKAIQTVKELSSTISSKYLSKSTDILNLIPDRKIGTTDDKTLKKNIIENTWPVIKKLAIGSQFGVLDDSLVKSTFNSGVDLTKLDENNLYTHLAFINNVQKIVQGTVLINNSKNNDALELGSIPPDLAQTILDLYTSTIINKVELKHDHIADKVQESKLNSLSNSKNNLRQFFNKCGRNEASSFKEIANLEKLPIWNNLELDTKTEIEKIKAAWVPAGTVSKLLGRTKEEKLPGYTVEETPLLNFLFNDADARRQFERITLELSLLAGIDAISTYKGWKKADELLLENHKNYQQNSIPWMKDFYLKRLAAMNDLISKEKSEINISSVVEYISHLALELTNTTQLFSADNYLERYGAEPYVKELFKFMFDKTRTGILPLNILLAQSLGAKENSILNEAELKQLSELIEFIKTESLIKDAHGDIQYAPIGHSKAIDDTFAGLTKSLSNTGFLLNHSDLIMKFLKKSIEAALKIHHSDKDSAELDILKSHNIILATWLFYILVKFLPEKTDDIEALRIKAKIAGVMFDEKLRADYIIPKPLYNKLRIQALGLNDDNQSIHPKQKGTFRSLFEELDSRITAIAEGKEKKTHLKDLIYIYAELEKNIAQNPRTLGIINRIFKDKKLLEGLDKAITKVLDVDLDLIVNYAKNHDQRIRTAVANSLLEKITNLTSQLTKQHLNQYGELEVKDTDQETIINTIKALNYMNHLGYLLNSYNDKNLSLKTSLFLDPTVTNKEQQIKQIQNSIDLIERFLKLKVNLVIANDKNIDPQNEAFPNQLNSKNILIGHLQKFSHSLRPAAGLIFEWRDLSNIAKLRQRSLHFSKESTQSAENSRAIAA